jgi:hypothetical protein
MKPLFTEILFQKSDTLDFLPLECEHCGKVFYKRKSSIQSARENYPNFFQFCSNFCRRKAHKKSSILNLNCEQCGKKFHRTPSEIKKTKHHFCCQSCAATYSNQHKTKGYRRSKLEVWLETKLTSLYPYEFHFNRTDAINAELDIYIPELKLAFELNGIFHYEPVYGQNKLDKIQNNDNRKMLACAEQGISLCVLDVSRFGYFKEKGATKYLNIIRKIIDEKALEK